jgi:transcriptional regulator
MTGSYDGRQMHTYERYQPRSQAEINRLVREHPVAVVVSAAPGEAPVATHVPMIVPLDRPPDAPLVGMTLRGHMGRANPHWEQFGDGRKVLLVFGTSHAYVTPQSYDPGATAPTLDYAAVHLTGPVELIEDAAETLDVVETTVARFESARPTQWDSHDSRELFDRILPGVVAFRVRIETQHAMFKLSQDKTESVRRRVRDDLNVGPHQHPDVVAWMDRFEEPA